MWSPTEPHDSTLRQAALARALAATARQYEAIEERRRGLIAQTFSAAPVPTM
jgi:hypothetical protein